MSPLDSGNRRFLAVLGFALAAAVGHALRLPFPYVPPSARLLPAVVAGAVLGPVLGAASQSLFSAGYCIASMVAAAPSATDWTVSLPPDLGYVLGLAGCAAVAGRLAGPRRKAVRSRLLVAGVVGLLVVDASGLAALAVLLPPRLPEPLAPGGLLRVGLLFPLPWDIAQLLLAAWLVPILRQRAPWLASPEKSR